MASYTVKRGDNLTTIAKKYGTSATALIAANKSKVGANPNRIFSGTVLTVPGGTSKKSPQGTTVSSTGSANAGGAFANSGSPGSFGSTPTSRKKAAGSSSSPKKSSSAGRGSTYADRQAASKSRAAAKPAPGGGGSSPKSSSSTRGKSFTSRSASNSAGTRANTPAKKPPGRSRK